jgi:hypothetical protein
VVQKFGQAITQGFLVFAVMAVMGLILFVLLNRYGPEEAD